MTIGDESHPEFAPDGAVAPTTPPPPVGRLQRYFRGRAPTSTAFTIAVAIHAALILGGLYLYKTTQQPDNTRIVVPQGSAVERGDAGAAALTPGLPAVSLVPPPGGDEAVTTPADPLGPLPAEVATPVPTVPPTPVDDALGTKSNTPIPTPLSGESVPTPPSRPVADPSGNAQKSDAPPPAAPVEPVSTETGTDTAQAAAGRQGGAGPAGASEGEIDPQAIPVYYPRRALEQGWGGTTVARFDIDRRGKVKRIRIVTPAGHDILNEAAIEGLQRWAPPRNLWEKADVQVPFIFDPRATH